MAKYIKADELNRVKFHPLPYPHITPADIEDAEAYKRGWNDAIDAIIENEPPADVVERKDLISDLRMIVSDLNKEMDKCLERKEFMSRFYLKAERSMVEHLISLFEEANDGSPVVRCKDCKWFVKREEVCKLHSNNYEPAAQMSEDDFCSRGERREDE